jgi:antitoxin ParD1/3/4
MTEHDTTREAKLAALRHDIAAGLSSGAAEPLDMEKVKSEARKRAASRRCGTTEQNA